MATPTIHIHHDGFPGGVFISADEFDAAVHRRFGEVAQQAPAAGGGDPIQTSECVVVAGSDSAEELAAKMAKGAQILAARGVQIPAAPAKRKRKGR